MSDTSYQGGDQIDIDGATITLCRRKSSAGIRWTWAIPSTGLMGEMYHATPEAAIAHARKTMDSPECAHGEQGFCITCHDTSNR
jgi:hypothetical protein